MTAPLVLLLSYLLGSIPFGYILVRLFRKEDIRRSGSGNIGATNVARSSPALGVLTLVLDALKGLSAVVIARHFASADASLAAGAALAAVVGHMFPVWLGFRGGKGVATGIGAFVLLAPKTMAVMVGVFLAVVAVSRYVSLGSLVAAALLPLLAWKLDRLERTPLLLAGMASLLVIVKHHANIRRLLDGTESRLGGKSL
jgi:glycerol-3-phosphate acyltransferase PlsY